MIDILIARAHQNARPQTFDQTILNTRLVQVFFNFCVLLGHFSVSFYVLLKQFAFSHSVHLRLL